MTALRLLSFAALALLTATGSKALDIPTEITLCDGSYTYVRPTPAERNSSTGFEYHLSYSSDFAAPSLITRYFDWPSDSEQTGPVRIRRNATFDSATNTTITRSNPSYLVDFSFKQQWSSLWYRDAGSTRAYMTVTLVANVTRTITYSVNNGNVSEVNYLLNAQGQPVRARSSKPLYCNQYINKDGGAKSRASTGSGRRRWTYVVPILVPCLIGSAIVIFIATIIYRSPKRRAARAQRDRRPGLLRRRWQERQRRRAVEAMDEPAFIDDTEKQQGPDANWSSAAVDTRDELAVRMPATPSPARAVVSPVAAPPESPDRIDAGPLPQGDAMDGHPKPPPAYVASPPTYPSNDR